MSHITPLSQVVDSIKQTPFVGTPFEFLSKTFFQNSLFTLKQIGLVGDRLMQQINNMKTIKKNVQNVRKNIRTSKVLVLKIIETSEDLELMKTLYVTICGLVGVHEISSYDSNTQTTNFNFVEDEQLRSIKSMFKNGYSYRDALHFVSVFTFRFNKFLQDITPKTKTNKCWKVIEHSTKSIKEPNYVNTNVDHETCTNAIEYVKEYVKESITEPITEPMTEPVVKQVSDISTKNVTKTVTWKIPKTKSVRKINSKFDNISENNNSFMMQCLLVGGVIGSCLLIANYIRK